MSASQLREAWFSLVYRCLFAYPEDAGFGKLTYKSYKLQYSRRQNL